jgi:hypothetical protein
MREVRRMSSTNVGMAEMVVAQGGIRGEHRVGRGAASWPRVGDALTTVVDNIAQSRDLRCGA